MVNVHPAGIKGFFGLEIGTEGLELASGQAFVSIL